MENSKQKINESMENYLETILILSKRLPVVRSVDIAEDLGFKKSSISVAMKKLRESGEIEVTREGYIYLTDSGKKIAAEAARMGYDKILLPDRNAKSLMNSNFGKMEIVGVRDIHQAIQAFKE